MVMLESHATSERQRAGRDESEAEDETKAEQRTRAEQKTRRNQRQRQKKSGDEAEQNGRVPCNEREMR